MAEETASTTKKKRRSPFGKRQLSRDPTTTLLLVPDKQLFDEIVKNSRSTASELARDIIHEWAEGRRPSATQEGPQGLALIDLQKETRAAVKNLGNELSGLVKQLLDAATYSHGDLLSLNSHSQQSTDHEK